MATYDLLSDTSYKRICTCANMVSDISVIIEDTSITTDNTWSSQKIAEELLNVKDFLREYMKEEDLNKIDVTISNVMPSEDRMKENTLYIIKIFDESDFNIISYYDIYMKFGPNIVFLGNTNIGKDVIYTKEDSDTNFLCSQVAEANDMKGLAAGTLYRIFHQVIPVKRSNNNEVYAILCDRKNNTHADKFVVGVQNFTDRINGSVVYKIMNGICTVSIDIKILKNKYTSDLLEYDIVNDGMLPAPVCILNNATPCTVLYPVDAEISNNLFCYLTVKGGIILYGDGLNDTSKERNYKGSFTYSVM